MSNQQIHDLGQRWANAERNGDYNALDNLLDNDFVAVGPRGFELNHQQWLDRYRSGDLKNDSFLWQEEIVREYGNAAIVTGIQTQQTKWRGQDSNGRFRVTHVYIRKDGHWLIANTQLSGPIPEIPRG